MVKHGDDVYGIVTFHRNIRPQRQGSPAAVVSQRLGKLSTYLTPFATSVTLSPCVCFPGSNLVCFDM